MATNFYLVLNQEYGEQIALKWNTEDEASGYCGIVTKFEMVPTFLNKYKVQNVGGFIHNELWIPSEELEDFNKHIIGKIEIVKIFTGKLFDYNKTDRATQVIKENI